MKLILRTVIVAFMVISFTSVVYGQDSSITTSKEASPYRGSTLQKKPIGLSFFEDYTLKANKLQFLKKLETAGFTHAQMSGTCSSYDCANYPCASSPNCQKCTTLCMETGVVYCYRLCVKKGEIKLLFHAGGVKRTYEHGDINWGSASCTVDILGYNVAGTQLFQTTKNLLVNPERPEMLSVSDYTSYFPNPYPYPSCATGGSLHHIEFRVTNYTPSSNALVNNDIRLDVAYCQENSVDVIQPNNATEKVRAVSEPVDNAFYPSITPCSQFEPANHAHVAGNPITLRWHYAETVLCPDDKFPNYQVQILRVRNVDKDLYANIDPALQEYSVNTYYDWNKALTIETGSSKNELTLTLAEGRGYYVWRVRPIGNAYEGGITNPLNLGEWSYSLSDDPLGGSIRPCFNTTVDIAAAMGKYNSIFFYEGLEEDKNWSFARSFTESVNNTPRMTEGMVFMDGLSSSVQVQQYSQADNKTVLNQQVFDYSGRPTIKTLGAPIGSGSADRFSYAPNALQTSSAGVFDHAAVDGTNYNPATPTPMLNSGSNTNTISTYYSDANPDISVPGSGGFPYSKLIVGNDGRIQEIGGVGPDHQISGSHTTKIWNAVVTDQELTSVLGDEAPTAKSVTKTIVKDVHGVYTATYTSKEGAVLATCLVGVQPGASCNPTTPKFTDNLSDVTTADGIKKIISVDDDSSPLLNMLGDTVNVLSITDVMKNNEGSIKNEYQSLMSRDYFISNPGTQFTVDYTIDPKTFQTLFGEGPSCNTYCAQCDYRVDVKVIKTKDLSVLQERSIIIPAVNSSGGCNPTPSSQQISPNISLCIDEIGTYTVQRVITALNRYSNPPPATYEDKHVEVGLDKGNIRSIDDILTELFGSDANKPNNEDMDPMKKYNYVKQQFEHYKQYIATHDREFSINKAPNNNCRYIYLENPLCEFSCKDENNNTKDFEKYLVDELRDYVTETPEPLGNPCSEYNLNDYFVKPDDTPKKYATTGSNPSCRWFYNPNATDNSPANEKGLINNMMACGYNCDDLWASWVATVAQYKGQRMLMPQKNNEYERPYTAISYNSDGTPKEKYYFDLLETFLDNAGRYKGNISTCPPTKTSDYEEYIRNAQRMVYVPGAVPSGCAEPQPPYANDQERQDKWNAFNMCVRSLQFKEKKPNAIDDIVNRLGLTLPCENPQPVDDPCFEEYMQSIRRKCYGVCESKRKVFDRKYREYRRNPQNQCFGFPPVVDPSPAFEAEVRCVVERLVQDCRDGCNLQVRTNTTGEYEEMIRRFKESMTGDLEDIKCQQAVSPSCSVGYRPIGDIINNNAEDVYRNLASYLTTKYIEFAIKAGAERQTQVVNFSALACDYLTSMGKQALAFCFCSGIAPLMDVRVVPGSVASFAFVRTIGEGENTCCQLSFTHELPCLYGYGGITNSLNDNIEGTWRRMSSNDANAEINQKLLRQARTRMVCGSSNWDCAILGRMPNQDYAWTHLPGVDEIISYNGSTSFLAACDLLHGEPYQLQNDAHYGLSTLSGSDRRYDHNYRAKLKVGSTEYIFNTSGQTNDSPDDERLVLLRDNNNVGDNNWHYYGSILVRLPHNYPAVGNPQGKVERYQPVLSVKILPAEEEAVADEQTAWAYETNGFVLKQYYNNNHDVWDGSTENHFADPNGDYPFVEKELGNSLMRSAYNENPVYGCNAPSGGLTISDIATNTFTEKIGYFDYDQDGFVQYHDRVNNTVYTYWNSRAYYTETELINCALSCDATITCPALCVKYRQADRYIKPQNRTIVKYSFDDCASTEVARLKGRIREQYIKLLERLEKSVRDAYHSACRADGDISETLTVNYTDYYYHYTLYYYDRAGNLVRTVPPRGVNITPTRTRSTNPQHWLATQYDYNSYGQVVREKTPDGGETWYCYNIFGELRFSQDARQRAMSPRRMSFIDYDNLGRVTRSGEVNAAYNDGTSWFTLFGSLAAMEGILINNTAHRQGVYARPTLPASVPNPPPMVLLIQEEKNIIYTTPQSLPAPYNNGLVQNNLNNRISKVTYSYHDPSTGVGAYNASTYYSYDPHGNVEWVIQQQPDLYGIKIEYDYDLISGNVNMVRYRPGFADQHFRKFDYDADNRLKNVYTSLDGTLWQKDATYEYYEYGPLRRVVLGEDSVQGVDYTYTIQGWLKGINHPGAVNATTTTALNKDPGHDGIAPAATPPKTTVAKDAFGMALGFYNGDFNRSVGSTTSPFNQGDPDLLSIPSQTTGNRQLYNGNIAAWTTNTQLEPNPGTPPAAYHKGQVTAELYRYDKLNRLREGNFNYRANNGTGAWATNTDNRYNSRYKYDEDGNLRSLKRWAAKPNGTVDAIDEFSYSYPENGGLPISSKLRSVADAITNSGVTGDIPNGQGTDNYSYDAAGNLTADVQEGLTITWDARGKVIKVVDANATPTLTTTFRYDADGYRIYKKVDRGGDNSNGRISYYVYDATGNLLSVYETIPSTLCSGEGANTCKIYLSEIPISGSTRLGMRTFSIPTCEQMALWGDCNNQIPFTNNIIKHINQPLPAANSFVRYTDRTVYELTDHLGNVRAVVGDLKLPDGNGSFIADLKSTSDYYPFGMEQPGRNWSLKNYRYGFNGKEKDNELKGDGNSYDYGFRMYDTRAARFLSNDPLDYAFPWNSPFAFAENTPIAGLDLDGKELYFYKSSIDKATGQPLYVLESYEDPSGTVGLSVGVSIENIPFELRAEHEIKWSDIGFKMEFFKEEDGEYYYYPSGEPGVGDAVSYTLFRVIYNTAAEAVNNWTDLKAALKNIKNTVQQRLGNLDSKRADKRGRGVRHGKKPAYDDPGTHPGTENPGRNGAKVDPSKDRIPDDVKEAYKHALPDPTNEKTWWGRGKDGNWYRFQQHEPGKMHFNGRSDSPNPSSHKPIPPNSVQKIFEEQEKARKRAQKPQLPKKSQNKNNPSKKNNKGGNNKPNNNNNNPPIA